MDPVVLLLQQPVDESTMYVESTGLAEAFDATSVQAADPRGGGGGDPQCLLSVIVHVCRAQLLNLPYFWSKVML